MLANVAILLVRGGGGRRRRPRRWCFSTCCILFFILHRITTATGYSPSVAMAMASETRELHLQQLSSQIDALILQRQDDANKLEAVARNSLNKDAEIDQLRNEIRDLKMELDSVKAKSSWTECADGGANGCGNRVKNEQLTVDWLSNSVSEIRAEIAEMAKSFNSTAALQQRQSFSTDISILQNDVVSLRHDVEHLKADAAKYDAKLSAFGLDADALKQSTSGVAAKVVNLTQQIRVFSAYAYAYDNWRRAKPPPPPPPPSKRSQHLAVFKKMMVLNENPLTMRVFTSTRRRRRRVNRRKSKTNDDDDDYDYSELRYDSVDRETRSSGNFTLKSASKRDDDDVRVHVDHVDVDVQLEKRVRKLENLMNETKTSCNGEQDRLRSSMLELLELVQNVEAKFDNVTPLLKKEISKTEFALAQIIANLSIARQHRQDDKSFVATMAENLSETRSKLARYEYQISVEREKIGNILTLASFASSSCNEIKRRRQQNSTQLSQDGDSIANHNPLSSLSQLFSSLLNQYVDYVGRLPKNCDQVEGKSDLYLLSVDDAMPPVFVFCEKKQVDAARDSGIDNGTVVVVTSTTNSSTAYVVIQRRTNDRTDFNRDWQEYARGFGNLRGEFWLGNEIIHRLTKNNDTALRIELEEASGRRWYAEYDTFSVASAEHDYELHVDGFSGNATDAFRYHNGMRFSTKDSDHDTSDANCAADYESGWWFSHCQHANLNAKHDVGLTWFDSSRNEWIAISSAKMMLTKRRRYTYT